MNIGFPRVRSTGARLALLGAAGAVLAFSSGAAGASSPCASPYVVKPGDTAATIVQQCRIPREQLRAANPQIGDIDRIAAGDRLTIPGGDRARGANDASPAPAEIGAGQVRVQPGDTLYSIAQSHDTSVEALLDANPDVDPSDMGVGTVLQLPGSAPRDEPPRPSGEARDKTLEVQPLSGAPGTPVSVRGAGYAAGAKVTIGAGPPEAEWQQIASATADDAGRFERNVDIPDWAKPGDHLVFVAAAEGEVSASRTVGIVKRRDPDAPTGEPADGTVTVEGIYSTGVECPVLKTDDGRVFSLTGAPAIDKGARVRVTGTMPEVSFCMQGQATIAVDAVSSVSADED